MESEANDECIEIRLLYSQSTKARDGRALLEINITASTAERGWRKKKQTPVLTFLLWDTADARPHMYIPQGADWRLEQIGREHTDTAVPGL